MKPSTKAEEIETVINAISGDNRVEAITANRCVKPPIGCGKEFDPATQFRNEISRREFCLSSLCQACQDSFFGILTDTRDIPY